MDYNLRNEWPPTGENEQYIISLIRELYDNNIIIHKLEIQFVTLIAMEK